ncbi:MAG: rRNA adenine N-6-methyltransferase family protein [Nanoarchaeota archaeon]
MKYDQHFMIDLETAKKIVSFLEMKKDEKILEIGPGKGILTQFLKGDITLIEIDKNLCNELKERFPDIKIINRNVLHYNGNFDKIISNVPYSICEPLMNKLMKMSFKKAILTVPSKFLEKGLLNLIMHHFFKIKKLIDINKHAFYPVPKVDSKVIQVEHKKLNDKEKLLRNIYIQSDKKLKNVLKQKLDLEFLDKKIYQMNFNEWEKLVNVLGL